MKKPLAAVLPDVVAALRSALGGNLGACCVYGSAVRGNLVEGVSDINLLIVLEESNAGAHDAVARALAPFPLVSPFVLGRAGLARTARCFANKFASIRRHLRVLHGADPFDGIAEDRGFERLLCEQGLRNLRLRLTYAFVRRGARRSYGRFLQGCIAALFVQLSDAVRLSGHEVPPDFGARIPVIARVFAADAAILGDLHALRQHPRTLPDGELHGWHARVLGLLDAALAAIERDWPSPGASAP